MIDARKVALAIVREHISRHREARPRPTGGFPPDYFADDLVEDIQEALIAAAEGYQTGPENEDASPRSDPQTGIDCTAERVAPADSAPVGYLPGESVPPFAIEEGPPFEFEPPAAFRPGVFYNDDIRLLTEIMLEDTAIVWCPWGPYKGHAVDCGYDFNGNLVGMRIWDDVRTRDALEKSRQSERVAP